MLSIEQQISKKCIYFNGVMSKVCKKGIIYADVQVDKSYKFPCLQQGGKCEHAKFMTDDEVKAKIAVIKQEGVRVLTALALVIDHYGKTKKQEATIPCSCGGKLSYIVADTNGHIWARCNSCGISFNQ